jgi:hypothetical protein
MFTRRLGTNSPEQSYCAKSCPDILEMKNGDFAVIGADITGVAASELPPGSGCGPEERIVRIPRALLLRARADITAEA